MKKAKSRSSSSSSGGSDEENGNGSWRDRIFSAAAAADYVVSSSNGFGSKSQKISCLSGSGSVPDNTRTDPAGHSNGGLKLYQIKARKLLDEMLEKSLEIVQDSSTALTDRPQATDDGVRLFRKAPPGIILDPGDIRPRPTKRPQIIPGEETNEKSKKFRHQIRQAAVEGHDIMASAKNTMLLSLSRFEAREAAVKAAAKREEERVAGLKKIRGEKWLPSISRQNKVAHKQLRVRSVTLAGRFRKKGGMSLKDRR